MLRSVFLAALACLTLAGCAEDLRAPYEEIAARAYVDDGPPSLTLYTVIRTADGSGGHSALLINGPQRVLFDPAGSFAFPSVPERGDLLFGITPRVKDVYIDFHARESWDVLEQTIEVPAETAALALRLAQENGAVSPAQCSLSISGILRRLPGFEDIRSTWFPVRLSEAFAGRALTSTRVYSDDDSDNNHGVLIQASEDFARDGDF